MPTPEDTKKSWVLHIQTSSSAPTSKHATLHACLAKSSLNLVTFHDVYMGLARALDERRECPQAVIVNVDGIAREEFEFFNLLHRHQPDTTVFIYGSDIPRGKALPLLRAGRDIDLTTANLDALMRAICPVPADPPSRDDVFNDFAAHEAVCPEEESSAIPAATEIANTNPEPALKLVQDVPEIESTTPETIAEEDETPEPIDTTARVPWKSYSDAPVRLGPQRTKSQEAPSPIPSAQQPAEPFEARQIDEVEPPQSPVPTSGPNGTSPGVAASPLNVRPQIAAQRTDASRFAPLLTREELEALMADDETPLITAEERSHLLADYEELS